MKHWYFAWQYISFIAEFSVYYNEARGYYSHFDYYIDAK